MISGTGRRLEMRSVPFPSKHRPKFRRELELGRHDPASVPAGRCGVVEVRDDDADEPPVLVVEDMAG
jgi:hypothetical protein